MRQYSRIKCDPIVAVLELWALLVGSSFYGQKQFVHLAHLRQFSYLKLEMKSCAVWDLLGDWDKLGAI